MVKCTLPYFLGHWMAPLIVLAGMGIGAIVIVIESVPSYESAELAYPWDNNKVPFVAALLSDLHHTQILPDRLANMQAQLGNVTRKFNPAIIALSGDLVDSLNETNTLSFHRQYEKNWQRYNLTRYLTGFYDEGRHIFESAGNHDMMVVAEDNEQLNKYRHYTMKPNTKFSVRAYPFDTEYSVPVNVIIYNPLRAPYTSGPLGVFPCHHGDDVEALDALIRKDARNVIITHFPIPYAWNTEGDLKVRDVITRSHLYLSGHRHPKVSEITRKKNMLHTVVNAFFKTPEFLMTFIDNGGAGAQIFDTRAENPVLVTYPLPKKQLTGRSVFNLNSFPVRAYTFGPAPLYLTVYIDDNYYGVMKHQQTPRRNVHFYTLDVNVSDGTHRLKVGDYEMTFFIGHKTEPDTIITNNLYDSLLVVRSPFVFLVMILAFLLPWCDWFPSVKEVSESFERIMYGEAENNLKWYQMPLHALTYWWCKMRKIPAKFRTHIGIGMFWYLLVPWYWMYVDDYLALVWLWGVKINGTFSQYAMTFVIWMIYLFLFTWWSIQVLGIWYDRKDVTRQWYNWLELALPCLPVVAAVVGWPILAYLAGGWFTVLTSPLELYMLGTVYWYGSTIWKEAKSEEEDENSEQELLII